MNNKSLKLIKSEQPDETLPEIPQLTLAEQAEVDRFKALTTRRAARRAKVAHVTARFQAADDMANAA